MTSTDLSLVVSFCLIWWWVTSFMIKHFFGHHYTLTCRLSAAYTPSLWPVYITRSYTNCPSNILFSNFSCDYDYLVIYDGKSKNDSLIGKFCGGDDVEVVSSGTDLYIEFVSDDSGEANGFRLKFTQERESREFALSGSEIVLFGWHYLPINICKLV